MSKLGGKAPSDAGFGNSRMMVRCLKCCKGFKKALSSILGDKRLSWSLSSLADN